MSSVAARIAAAQAERDLSEAPVDIFHAFNPGSASQLEANQHDDEKDTDDEEEVGEPGGGRISMYVRIVHEMFETVLEGEDYLFTSHERAVLRKFLALKCESGHDTSQATSSLHPRFILADEPKYLLTRLLLRKTNKIFSHNELSVKYSSELGEDNVAAYMDILTSKLDFHEDEYSGSKEPAPGASQSGGDVRQHERFFTADELADLQLVQTNLEPEKEEKPDIKSAKAQPVGRPERPSKTAIKGKAKVLNPANDPSNPIVLESSDEEVVTMKTKPSSRGGCSMHSRIDLNAIATGLTKEEEAKDPELARAIRLSKYEALKKTMASTEGSLKSGNGTGRDTKPLVEGKADLGKGKAPAVNAAIPVKTRDDDFYRLKEDDTEDITTFARGSSEMAVEEMIRHLNMAELTLIAKELKCWKSKFTVSRLCSRCQYVSNGTRLLSAARNHHRTPVICKQADPSILCRGSRRGISIPIPQYVTDKFDADACKVAADHVGVHAETCTIIFGSIQAGRSTEDAWQCSDWKAGRAIAGLATNGSYDSVRQDRYCSRGSCYSSVHCLSPADMACQPRLLSIHDHAFVWRSQVAHVARDPHFVTEAKLPKYQSSSVDDLAVKGCVAGI